MPGEPLWLTWQKRYMGWSLGSSRQADSHRYLRGADRRGVLPEHDSRRGGDQSRSSATCDAVPACSDLVGAAVALPSPGESDEELLARLRSRSDPARRSSEGGARRPLAERGASPGPSGTPASTRSASSRGTSPSCSSRPWLGQSSTRVASYGWWLRIRPLRPWSPRVEVLDQPASFRLPGDQVPHHGRRQASTPSPRLGGVANGPVVSTFRRRAAPGRQPPDGMSTPSSSVPENDLDGCRRRRRDLRSGGWNEGVLDRPRAEQRG